MSEEKRAKTDDSAAPMTAEEQAQQASDSLKDQIAALRSRVKNAHRTLSQHAGRERGGKPEDDPG